jgi:hypothetical protein
MLAGLAIRENLYGRSPGSEPLLSMRVVNTGFRPLLVIVKREILRETYGHPRQEVVR